MLSPERVVEELRELNAATGNAGGAQRTAWTPGWDSARRWLSAKLGELPVEQEIDEAGNQWASLRGRSERSLLIGGHLDSVPDGGWLDGCLNVVAGLEVLRRLAAGPPPPLCVRLVSWADEEGARFGRSLLGSSAATGALDPEQVRSLRDAGGTSLPDAMSAFGVDLASMGASRRQLVGAAAYLELHIEQGPVLERLGLPLGVVTGTFGVERHELTFEGQAAHAGSTPMELRRDPMCAAARLVLQVREIARREGGVGTVGRLASMPATPTAIPGRCSLTIDQRHLEAAALARMLEQARAAAATIAAEEGVSAGWSAVFSAQPVAFDPELVSICEAAVLEVTGGLSHRLPSGPLHDATSVAASGVPTGMIFVQSRGGLSHTRLEDTLTEHLELAVAALDRATDRALDWLAG